MRRFRILLLRRAFLASLAMSALASCGKPENGLSPQGGIRVGFYAGECGSTRSSMSDDGLSAKWSDGDVISVWAKNSASSYTLANKSFSVYGTDGARAFFSTTIGAAMPDDSYTYFACYPQPQSLSGTSAVFSLPSVQDGRVSGGADIMIAEPVTHGALKTLEESSADGMSMSMKHVLHQLRFWLPEEDDAEAIYEIHFSMPDNVCGTVTADFTDPDAALSLGNGDNSIQLQLAEPLEASDASVFACAAIFPHDEAYTEDDYLNLTIYTHSGKVELAPISLAGRSFVAGHSTPVRLDMLEVNSYYRLTFNVGANHIGEELWNISISSGGSVIYRWANTDGVYQNFSFDEELLGESGRTEYEALVSAINNGSAVLNFETSHASVDIPLDASYISVSDNLATVNLGDVPYLIEEDFSSASAVAHNDSYSASTSSDLNLDGYLIDGLSQSGWNGARFSIIEGDCARINCRYQSGGWVVGRYCGRLDTPALSRLKSGVSVKVRLEYSQACYIPAAYNCVSSTDKHARYHVGTHTLSQTSAIDGVTTGNISSSATILYTSGLYASEDVSSLHSRSLDISGAGPSTRIVFFADTDYSSSKVAANACFYIYLDDIKVYIAN